MNLVSYIMYHDVCRCPTRLSRTISCLDQAMDAALALRFSPEIEATAERIITALGGSDMYNGIHLRYELV